MFLLKICPLNKDQKKITGFVKEETESDFDNERYVLVNEEVFEFVSDNYGLFSMTFGDNITDLTVNDIKTEPIDSFMESKNNAMALYKRKYVNDVVDTEFYISFIEYTNINNIMNSNGYFITEDNREEKYIEILNTGNMELITLLERYLASMDDINLYKYRFDEFIKFKRELHECSSLQEVKDMYRKFTREELFGVLAK